MRLFQKRSSSSGLTQGLRMMLVCAGTLVGAAPLVGCSGGVEDPASRSDSITSVTSSNDSDDGKLKEGTVYQIKMRTPAGQTGVVASWGAHAGLTSGGNPLQIYTGDYSTCAPNDCSFTFMPIPGKLDTYSIQMRTPAGQTGVVASWGAHAGLTSGGNALRIYTGDYSTCAPNDCDFIVTPVPRKPNTYSIHVQTPGGQTGVVASWGAHEGLVNGGNALRIYTGDYSTCMPNDCDFIITPGSR